MKFYLFCSLVLLSSNHLHGIETQNLNIEVLCERQKVSCLMILDDSKYEVVVGKNYLSDKKIEGDDSTPIGKFQIEKNIFYRNDNMGKLKNLHFNFIKIKENYGWCHDQKSKNYNKFINIKSNHQCKSFEYLKRKDHLYDLVLVLNYNRKPIIPGKGSAIFIHMSKNDNSPTAGCIGLKKSDLMEVVNKLRKNHRITIKYIR